MDKSLIIILAVILLILVLLNNVSLLVSNTQVNNVTAQGNCSQTAFGCCPDGINSKINFHGTNCPNYNPGAGYPAAHNKPTVVVTHT